MRTVVRVLLSAILLWAGSGALQGAQKVDATLLLSHSVAKPGDTITAALKLDHGPGWHTYWRNPGDSGLPTNIEWELPEGVSAGEIQWPVPEKMVLLSFLSYVYEGELLLLVPVTINSNVPAGPLTLKGKADWLQCTDKTCEPEDQIIEATLLVGNAGELSPENESIEQWRKRLPRKDPAFEVKARWGKGGTSEERPLLIEWMPHEAAEAPDFFAYLGEGFSIQPKTEVLQADGQIVTIQKTVTTEDKWPTTISGIVLDRSEGEHPVAYEVALSIPEEPLIGAAGSVASGVPEAGPSIFAEVSLWKVVLFAFIGGLILNIMPCVLPVIALKVLSFVRQSGADHGRARQFGLIYAMGVVTSFLVIAGMIIAVQQAGGIASWGMQFQNPVFLVVMITLVTLIGLNLFGVFEITLGGRTMGAASEIAGREGKAGAFFHGVLATVLGTSCTAPFLAFAIGYALSQSAVITILLFGVMGIGLALPYVVLTWNPRLLKFLPKPGPWMERFKVAMGFPMLATAVWLFGVAVKAHFGANGAFWLALFLVLLGLGAWVWGEFVQRAHRRKPIGAAISLATIAFAFGFVLEKQLQWRNPAYEGQSVMANAADGIQWEKWSPEAVAKARAEGHPVLVDFTADWCLNCQANKITSIEIESVEEKLKEIGAVSLLADFTRKSPEIAEELRKFQRGGVPLVLVYPPDATAQPIVLPPTLTPQIVLDALEQAAGAKQSSSSQVETPQELTASLPPKP